MSDTHIERAPHVKADRLQYIRDALFPTPLQSAISLALIGLIAWIAYAFIDWAVVRAIYTGADGSACRVPEAGACWPFLTHKMQLFLYGRYTEAELWRVHLTYILALAGIIPLFVPGVPHKPALLAYTLLIFPILAFVLLYGGVLGLGGDNALGLGGGLAHHAVLARFGTRVDRGEHLLDAAPGDLVSGRRRQRSHPFAASARLRSRPCRHRRGPSVIWRSRCSSATAPCATASTSARTPRT